MGRFALDHGVDHDGIAIAVSEAVTNAVVHAYPDQVDGQVRLHATLERAGLLIVVADDGQGMAAPSDRGGMGVGLSLIARLCSSLEIESDGGGTQLTMRFTRAGAP